MPIDLYKGARRRLYCPRVRSPSESQRRTSSSSGGVDTISHDSQRQPVRPVGLVTTAATGSSTRTARELSARKRRLVATFDRLIADLRSERRALREPGGGSANVLAMRAVRSLQDAWQRLVLNWLHERALNPLFRLYRRLLALRLVSHRGR